MAKELLSHENFDSIQSNSLWFAIRSPNLEMAKLLLTSGKNIDVEKTLRIRIFTFTPLQFCAENGKSEIVQLLLPLSDINKGDEDDWTALHFAACHGHLSIVSLLLSQEGIDINKKNIFGSTPLDYARAMNHRSVESELKRKGGRYEGRENAHLN